MKLNTILLKMIVYPALFQLIALGTTYGQNSDRFTDKELRKIYKMTLNLDSCESVNSKLNEILYSNDLTDKQQKKEINKLYRKVKRSRKTFFWLGIGVGAVTIKLPTILKYFRD